MIKIPKGKILVEVQEPEKEVKTKSGLVIATQKIKDSKRYTTCGVGVAVKVGVLEESMEVKPGDKIYWQRYGETYVRTIEVELQKLANQEVKEENLAIIDEVSILMVETNDNS